MHTVEMLTVAMVAMVAMVETPNTLELHYSDRAV
jgi:hypothetical protein